MYLHVTIYCTIIIVYLRNIIIHNYRNTDILLKLQKLLEQSRSKMKGGSFKLNMHPKAFFDEKPFTSDKPLPPPKKTIPSKPITVAFKPSHPSKKVGLTHTQV